jgi:putative membrane protein
MLFVRTIGTLAALMLASTIACAQQKPTDPQIAHIAYTTGQIDIEAAQQALQKSQNNDVRAFAINTSSATTRW